MIIRFSIFFLILSCDATLPIRIFLSPSKPLCYLRRMRTRLTMTVAALLLIAMLLIWQRDARQKMQDLKQVPRYFPLRNSVLTDRKASSS
jgi:hypothetical protein